MERKKEPHVSGFERRKKWEIELYRATAKGRERERESQGVSGFNEDRRICPIKTSYKDPYSSPRSLLLIRKTSLSDSSPNARPQQQRQQSLLILTERGTIPGPRVIPADDFILIIVILQPNMFVCVCARAPSWMRTLEEIALATSREIAPRYFPLSPQIICFKRVN